MLWLAVAALVALAAAVALLAGGGSPAPSPSAARTPGLDPGTPLSGAAADFTLTDQFGARVSLRSLRGRAVILAFEDSRCTTVCPLSTTAMVQARRLLGPAASHVALLGVDANPHAISVRDVRAYSAAHGMLRSWRFLTGSLPQLEQVWRRYSIDVAIERGQIDHTPALFLITPGGRLDRVYISQLAYTGIDQQAQILARELSRVLPGHPAVASRLSYAPVPTIRPTARASLPRAGGGRVALGPGSPRLLAFFATWDAQVTPLGARLTALSRYGARAGARGLPPLVGVDEAGTEPSAAALLRFLGALPRPLAYPVAIDATGRLADGYGVQDQPWLVLVSAAGRVLWYYDIATSGWLSTTALERRVRAALSRPAVPFGSAAVQRALAGSPRALAALHAQSGQLLGDVAALGARLRALRGHPAVINAWASWCGPCRGEFSLFAAASARYGRRVAFLGADTGDSASDARAFLAAHPVSYPSYQAAGTSSLSPLAAIVGLPTTIFVDRSGRVAYVHTGQYASQGILDQDIVAYAR